MTLSIIILSYNTREMTIDCLDSILRDKGLDCRKKAENDEKIPTEIIVLDNNSQDGSPKALRAFKKKKKNLNLTLIESKKNLGFARGNNLAIKKSLGNYILLLNSDTLILHSSISQALLWLSAHPDIGACTAQLLNPDRTIQPSGGFFPTLLNLSAWALHLDDLPLVNKIIPPLHPHSPRFYLKSPFYRHSHSQDWITAAFFLVRRSVIKETGGFDPHFFMYAEELEWCYRIRKKGWQIQYLTDPQIIHYGGQSSKNSKTRLLGEYKGLLKFFSLHRPSWQKKALPLLFKTNALISSLLGFLKKDKKKAKIYLETINEIR